MVHYYNNGTFIIKAFVSNTVKMGKMWTIALQADLRCGSKFSACAPKHFQSGATVLLIKIVSLELCVWAKGLNLWVSRPDL